MKHLRKYESYYSDEYQEMVDDIKDICIELEDEGMTINYFRTPSENVFSLIVSNGYDFSIEHRHSLTNEEWFNNIKNSFDRIRECGKVHGWGKVELEKIPASKGSTSSKIPAGGYMIRLWREVIKNPFLNESITNDDIDTIKDIILELSDDGFQVEVTEDIRYHKETKIGISEHKGVAIYIEADEMDFCYNDSDVIKSSLIRLNEYAKSIGCSMHIDPNAMGKEFIDLREFINVWGDEELSSVEIIIFEKHRDYPRKVLKPL